MSTLNNKIHPAVAQLIKPIAEDMTAIQITQRSNPLVNVSNEPPAVKERKKDCVHIIVENGEYQLATKKDQDGNLVCSACGRKINTSFDNTAIDKITAAIEVINQLVLFGTINGLQAAPLQNLISLKKMLPDAALLMAQLNNFVAKESSADNAEKNIGIEYANPSNMRSITGF